MSPRGRWSGTSWSGTTPIREELFGPERLEQHAETLAVAQPVTQRPQVVPSLHARLKSNASVLLEGYRVSSREIADDRAVVPAAEWLLDNYHLVEAQIREIHEDLSPDYYRQLPKLASGPFSGYPRVLGIAWAYVAHTDSRFDPAMLRGFIRAYQRIQPLTIGELWAIAITLRIVLVENLRRLAQQISEGLDSRRDADLLADQLLGSGAPASALAADVLLRSPEPLCEVFSAQLAKRLRDQDPRAMPALGWLEERLAAQGTSIDGVVERAQQRLGASNVSVRNVITSFRLISDIDWSELFESMSLVDEKLRAGSDFGAMDFPTRNLYRDQVEQLARGSGRAELDVVRQALAEPGPGSGRDPGYALLGAGRRDFERSIGFRPPARLRLARFSNRLGVGGYVGVIVALACGLIALGLLGLPLAQIQTWWIVLFALAAFVPASEVAAALVNRAVAALTGPVRLPGLALAQGVPASLRTLVAVPTLLTTEADLLEQVERLEVHYLSGAGGDLVYALLSDGVDADTQTLPGDALLIELAMAAIGRLNHLHGPGPAGDRFLLLHRRRLYNPGEGAWMGWERKRGKLHELNRLLRGAHDTSFMALGGHPPHVPDGVRYVITLDADTRLTRDAAVKLVGKMAHPLNRPRWSIGKQRVVEGYAILQPRVTPSLPMAQEGSLFQRAFSGPGGTDPYATTVSDVYQDLFGEGSYIGKGIYDIDAFEAALAGRIPENTMLSHDLFEGVFARSGLAGDIEVVEDFPSRYDVVAKRQHRWIRGDWQLLPRMFSGAGNGLAMPALGRVKMFDNLRRSVLAPTTLLGLGLCWLIPPGPAMVATALLLSTLAIPALLPAVLGILPRRRDAMLRSHFLGVAAEVKLAALRVVLSVVFLADQAWRAADAIARTLLRLAITRRHLLEWTTAANSLARPRLDVVGFYRQMAGGTVLLLAMAALALVLVPGAWPLVVPFALVWLVAPFVAQWVSRPTAVPQRLSISPDEARDLRLIGRRTWRYFETFVTPADHMLPPDNFQETPGPVIAHRTSPTNVGLYLLAAIAARDFGWAGTLRSIERLEAAFDTLGRLQRFHGHFLNWYDTVSLAVLPPAYVSSVDSGNLAGHLVALANACDEWAEEPPPDPRQGICDVIALVREDLGRIPGTRAPQMSALGSVLEEAEGRVRSAPSGDLPVLELRRLLGEAARLVQQFVTDATAGAEIASWMAALVSRVTEHESDCHALEAAPADARRRLGALAATARAMVLEMDFTTLMDPERRLLAIGYSVADNTLDAGCYDLLASEARLASLIAIAKGDLPTRHWFRLGRLATPVGTGSALISWSGSMFEYLMPSLVMRAPAGSMLEQTGRLIVARQQAHGHALGIPWGVSESAYNARDIEFTYQYSSFGVPGLGLKRGLAANAVVAPYATALASMVDPRGARQNFALLDHMGARGRYGFYEALDFTRSRVPERGQFALVRCFMAHHQGMTVVAIANALHDGRMRARFHREPMIMASELLLQERTPRNVVVSRPRAEEVSTSADAARENLRIVRRPAPAGPGTPVTHLLSNGHYAVMLTAAGAGYSRWGDIAITRWREDATREEWGTFLFARDLQSGAQWSVTAQPLPGADGERELAFGEDHAEFIHRDGGLTTTLDVLVSGEHDGEVRRVSIANSGWRSREIELTSYAELVLATPAADNAHPAFAKMFVQTEYLPEHAALLATRRVRSPGERQIWVAHFAVVEGEVAGEPQHETDRAKFFGEGRTLASAAALRDGRQLTGSVGTVLDPVFALRHGLRVAPGSVSRIAFWTVVADSREALLGRIDAHGDPSAFDRARTLAWTRAQVQLRHLDIDSEEAADFQQLAAPLIYSDRRFRAGADTIRRGAGPQSGLWQHAISGDLPIVLLRIEDIEDLAQVRQLLRAHEYWRTKRLGADLVIINERASSYVQDLQIAIEAAVRTRASHPMVGEGAAQGSVHVLRADLMSTESRALLQSVARIVVSARLGSISDQLARLRAPLDPVRAERAVRRPVAAPVPGPPPALAQLEHFNGLGGFDKAGREYVIVLGRDQVTPAPWINVVANESLGFQVSAEGSGYIWAGSSRENQITQWSNDPVTDPPGDAIYIRDEVSGVLWTPTAQPIRDAGTYVCRHGFGYSRFEHETNGIASDLLQFVPRRDAIRVSRLRLSNRSGRQRRISVTAYAEWVLGTSRGASAPFITTEMDAGSGAMLARNPWNTSFTSRVAFADLRGMQNAWTADRTEFLGRNGELSAPLGLVGRLPLSGATGCGLDPCAALQTVVELAAGEQVEIVAFLGQGESLEAARELLGRYRALDLDAVFADVRDHWEEVLGAVQVTTPDRAMDILLNGWLLYQTIACRIRARSAFYQASGAYGFRDQLQDGMALSWALPGQTRTHLLRSAARQFIAGDVQHWWLPHSGQGVRTRIADDHLWLAFATAQYIDSSGDEAILDEPVPFLEGVRLRPGENEHFQQPMPSEESGSLFEHCARGIDHALSLLGEKGLPLIGTGDWNDGMNRVGELGRGESVWAGWFLIRTVAVFAPKAQARDAERAARWLAQSMAIHQAIERTAWDGQWYRRATFDDGAWLGSKDNDECRIDSIAQSWAVLSGVADPDRSTRAMASLLRELVRERDRLVLLFTPPFDRTPLDPGYIKGYPPGLRENGGQYSHAAMWAVLALAQQGDGDNAQRLFALLNPINHARTPADVLRYRVEPYVVAADVYSVEPHAGRGGWTWYTGSAGWMYRAGVEGILGIRRRGRFLCVEPRISAAWSGFTATVNPEAGAGRIQIRVNRRETGMQPHCIFDGTLDSTADGRFQVPLDGENHELLMVI